MRTASASKIAAAALLAATLLFHGPSIAAAADAVFDLVTAQSLKVNGVAQFVGGVRLANQQFVAAGANDAVSEWNGAPVVILNGAKAQAFNLGACAGLAERAVTIVVKDRAAFARTVNGTSAEGVIGPGGEAAAPLAMSNNAKGDLRAASLYCDGAQWMVTAHETTSATYVAPPVAAATLAVARSANDADTAAGIVVPGPVQVLARFDFTAGGDDLVLDKIGVYTALASAEELYDVLLLDGNTLLGTATIGANGRAVVDIAPLSLPKNAVKTLTVMGTPAAFGANTKSGTDVKVALDTFSPAAGTFDVHRADGSSAEITTVGTADVLGNPKIYRRTRPFVTLVNLPTGALVDGPNVVQRFTVSATPAGDMAFQDLVPTPTASSGVVATCSEKSGVRRVGAENLEGTCTAGATVAIHFASEEVVAAGTSRTYDVRLSMAGTKAGSFYKTRIESTGFRWSDISAAAHDSTGQASADWFTSGLYVTALPSPYVTLTK